VIDALLRAAFEVDEVAHLVELLRRAPGFDPTLALVAVDAQGELVGQVMLTDVAVDSTENQDAGRVLSLAPLAVRPDFQRRGVGRLLVSECLALADRLGAALVVVEGDPAVYQRYGFVDAEEHGLLRPSPTIPNRAFQAFPLRAAASAPRGRVRYPAPFWAGGGSGLPEPAESVGIVTIPWLFQFARYAGWVEAVTSEVDLLTPVPRCPGWTVGDLLTHLGVVHRWAIQRLRDRRGAGGEISVKTSDPRAWYATGWREAYAALARDQAATPAATWCPFDTTVGFWRRRMLHEIVLHCLDAVAAGPAARSVWSVPDGLALDGIDEVLRVFLGIRVGRAPAGSGKLVEIRTGGEHWTVGLAAGHTVEVHSLPDPPSPEATVMGDPAVVYRWLWGRADDAEVVLAGDLSVISDLRATLTVATG
jgi:uncharacterized protein (TIGR03083 family)